MLNMQNAFFLNLVKIPGFKDVNPFSEKMSHLMLKAIFKNGKNPSIIAINNATNGWTFQFPCFSVDDAFKVIKNSACVNLPRVMTFSVNNLNLTKCNYFLWLHLKLFQFLCKWKRISKYPPTRPPFRKAYRSSKENYRSLSISLVITKILKKLLKKYVTSIIVEALSKY